MSERLERAKKLREERATLHTQMKEIVQKAKDENRAMTQEEIAQFDRLDEDIKAKGEEAKSIEAAADRETRIADIEAEFGKSQGRLAVENRRGNPADPTPEQRARLRKQAIRAWALGYDLTPEERGALPSGSVTREDAEGNPELARFVGQNALRLRLSETPARREWSPERNAYEFRAQSTTTTEGGYTVPNAAMAALEDALLAFGGMRQARTTKLRTATGASLPIPTENDTSNESVVLAENTQTTTTTDLTFGQVTLGAYKFTTNFIKASYEFLQDTSLDAESYISRKLGERTGRGTNRQFTVGDGSAEPQGIAWAATLGKTAASATALTGSELMDLEHSVDPAYRMNGEWMFADSTLKAIKQLTVGASDARFLWLPGLAFRAPDTILGYPYVVNQHMPAIAAGDRSVLFGDFSKYYIRDVMDFMVLRLVERGADYAQIWFIGFSRHDGALVDAGTNPIKVLRHPAS